MSTRGLKPTHHRAEEAVEAYVAAGGLEDARAPLFQSVDRSGRLSGRPLGRRAGAGDDQSPILCPSRGARRHRA